MSPESVDGRKYWNKLKQRLKDEGSELVTNCHQLKMKASDGKMRITDVAKQARLAVERETGESVITTQNAIQLNEIVTELIENVSSIKMRE